MDCAGIESPGLSSAPAIGERVAAIVERLFKPSKNADFIETRKGILNPKKLSEDEYKELIKEKPEYGNIICRCEMITEGEIMDAVNRPLGAKSLDGVKRRTRAGMGRCQAASVLRELWRLSPGREAFRSLTSLKAVESQR